mgnify:CR=1 FL=1
MSNSAEYQKLLEHTQTAIIDAENNTSKINSDILSIDGMTGVKTRHFYNNLLNIDDARYLEIGSWKGSSVCSAMYNNNAKIVCIDNWSQFGNHKEEFNVLAVTCNSNISKLREIMIEFSPAYVSIGKSEYIDDLKNEFPETIIEFGKQGLLDAVSFESNNTTSFPSPR